MEGATIAGTDRVGKLLLVDLGRLRPTLGLRFGMTGRLVVDDDAPIETLEYGSKRDDPAWYPLHAPLHRRRGLWLADPRRLGGVSLDPPVHELGPDAWTIGLADLRAALSGSTAPLKARLLDQSRIAGLGNLLADESLWRARLDPARPAGTLSPTELRRLHRTIHQTVSLLFERGGSHTGDLQAQRSQTGSAPRTGPAPAAHDRRPDDLLVPPAPAGHWSPTGEVRVPSQRPLRSGQMRPAGTVGPVVPTPFEPPPHAALRPRPWRGPLAPGLRWPAPPASDLAIRN